MELWRAIDNAPKDGTVLDLWQKEHWSQYKNRDRSLSDLGETLRARRVPDARWVAKEVDFYGEERPGWCIYKNMLLPKDQVTHWMLPPGPPEDDPSWQPIATAPKEGSLVDLWIESYDVAVLGVDGRPTGGKRFIPRRRDCDAYWTDRGYSPDGHAGPGWTAFKMMLIPEENVTHWRRVPLPPSG